LSIYDADSFEQIAGPFKEQNVHYRRPVFLSADEVAFVAYEEGYTGSIRLLDLDESRTEKLFPFTGPINGLAYQPQQNLLLVAGERDGEPDVFLADLSGDGSWLRVNATTPNTDRSGEHTVYAQ